MIRKRLRTFERNEPRQLQELSVRTTQTNIYVVRSLLLLFILIAGWNPVWGQITASAKEHLDVSGGYKEFLDRVQSYVRLHKTIGLTLPALKPTDRPELISAHQQGLARKIRPFAQMPSAVIFLPRTPKKRSAHQFATNFKVHMHKTHALRFNREHPSRRSIFT